MNIKNIKLALIISAIISGNVYADNSQNNVPQSNSTLSAEQLLQQNTGRQEKTQPQQEMVHFDPEKYDAKYRGLIQLLNDAQLSEGEYLGAKRVVETQKENPALEMGILYFTVLHEKDDADYKKAIYWLSTSSIDEKNSTADLLLGSIYAEGKGVDKSLEKAISFYKRSAERNNESAKLILTGLYLFDDGFKNKTEANRWLDDLSNNNNKYAILIKNINSISENDKNSYMKFIEPYFSYAKDGDEMALFTLGYLYYTGKFVGKDLEEANSYLRQSSLKGNPIAIIMFQNTLKELKKQNNTSEK